MSVLYVAVGVGFYWWQEDWSPAESFYFCTVALTTVGFGDLHPTTTFTQLFTAFYLLVGLGILGALVHTVMQHAAGRLPAPDRGTPDSDRRRGAVARGSATERDPTGGPSGAPTS